MSEGKRTVVLTGNRKVYPDMVTTSKSILYNNAADWLFFLTEDDKFPEDLPPEIININVSAQTWLSHDSPNFHTPWSYFTMMKAAVPYLFSGRTLVLDVDTIVCSDLHELWMLPDAPIYLVREIGRPYEYFNTGVMLINGKLMRQYTDEIFHRLNTKFYNFNEQDAINEVMMNRITPMPPEFNVSDWTEKTDKKPQIVHYAAIKDWHDKPLWQTYYRMPWAKALQKSKKM